MKAWSLGGGGEKNEMSEMDEREGFSFLGGGGWTSEFQGV